MPVPAHEHQHSPIPPFIVRELRYEQKYFREYFHWTGLSPAELCLCCGPAPATPAAPAAVVWFDGAVALEVAKGIWGGVCPFTRLGRWKAHDLVRAHLGETESEREGSATTGTTLVYVRSPRRSRMYMACQTSVSEWKLCLESAFQKVIDRIECTRANEQSRGVWPARSGETKNRDRPVFHS